MSARNVLVTSFYSVGLWYLVYRRPDGSLYYERAKTP